MKKVINDIINMNNSSIDKMELCTLVPERYKFLMDMINHVDTYLNGGKWRIQGYVDYNDLPALGKYMNEKHIKLDAYITISEEGNLEIWDMEIKYKNIYKNE